MLLAAGSLSAQQPKYPYNHVFHATVNQAVVYADAYAGATTAAQVNAAVSANLGPCVIIIPGTMSGTAGDFTGISLPSNGYRIEDERGPKLIWGFKDTVTTAVNAILTLDQTGITVPSCTGCGGGGTPGGSSGSVQYNNGGTFGGFGSWDGSTFTIPNASGAGLTFGNANGTITGAGGAKMGFTGGAIGLTAGGLNQNITLTPSGTGHLLLKPDSTSHGSTFDLYEDSGGTVATINPLSSAGVAQKNEIKFFGNETRIENDNGAGTYINLGQVSNAPHMGFIQSTYLPTTTGCGTGAAITAGSSDLNGQLTVGTTAGSCVVTFRGAFGSAPVAPICVDVTAKTVIGCTTSTTALTLGAVTDTDVINWWLTGK
jgi:hypothetical protein